ncbi:hypothetical protein M413DRAFT_447913 [Hebeloma cylindrosporum]|uniref:Uncharacterized protein n=1 Tax=Hebeloma cylindrosporum TaxID=76867 RepID=A0A0C3C1Q5_HEBCY|nr:hypothetical protein M413DRAFT_447913 [Hebeloma cylindrosporum h7]
MAYSPRDEPQSQNSSKSMILSLPPEIQGEIFARAHRDNSDDKTLLLPVEVTLSHVCSEWRNIAINLPTLWTAFKFDASPFSSSPVNKLRKYLLRSKALLGEYLLRSKSQLLELYFDIDDCGEWDAGCDQFLSQLLAIAVAHAGRWRRFSLFTTGAWPQLIEWLEQINAPNLEYFAVCLGSELAEGTEDPRDINPTVLIEGAPKLSIIRIDVTSHFHSLPPLANVTTLTIQDTQEKFEQHLYSFDVFRATLMMPTLTHLSIESYMCLENPRSLGNPEILPRIVMASLKTLRIIQDRNVLGILSLLDAPLLETLVLHMLDLRSFYIGQDVDKITPFQKLDTIALLNTSYDRALRSGHESLPVVIKILNKLACRATHIVISSFHNPLWIDTHINLLDFDQHQWPRLKRITLDVLSVNDLMRFVKNIERSAHSLTVRISELLLEHRSNVECDSLTTLERLCELETMKVGELMMDEYWPAPGGIFHEDGNLRLPSSWGESIRVRGPLNPWNVLPSPPSI